MKILFCTVPFKPLVGGIETVAAILADTFVTEGHEVVVVTQTRSDTPDSERYRVARCPGALELLRWHDWADVVFHNNISLRLAWPLLVRRKPWVIAHHTWIPQRGRGAFAGRLKLSVLRSATNVAVSHAVARELGVPAHIVLNPYQDDQFAPVPGVPRTRDLVFVGRLVSDKGVPILIEAVEQLRATGLAVSVTIVGSGPEDEALRRRVDEAGLSSQIEFSGQRTGSELVGLLNAHRLLIVPSVWEEPFGIVALEAMACGCVPVVAASGGLPEATGPAGRVFPKGDARALADTVRELLGSDAELSRLRGLAASHLALHTRRRVAQNYLKILERAARSSSIATFA